MKLISLTVGRFGNHEDLHLDFEGGLQSFCYPNGWGKSTLLAFIKVMFYGFAKNRGEKISENERAHYMPWGHDTAGGKIVFEKDGEVLRLERTFGKKPTDDTVRLFHEGTGCEIECPECPGESWFLIDADGFLRTVFLSEKQLQGKNENKTVAARLADLSGVDGDISNVKFAVDELEKERKSLYKKGGGGRIGEIGDKISRLRMELSDVTADLDHLGTLEKEREEKREEYKNKQAEKEELDKTLRELPEKGKREELLSEIEREKARTLPDRETLAKARAFLGNDPVTLDEIRLSEADKRASDEAKAKAEALRACGGVKGDSPFSAQPITDETFETMKKNEDTAKRLPLYECIAVATSAAAFLGIFLPFLGLLSALFGLLAAGAVYTAFAFLLLKKAKKAKADLSAFLSSYRTEERSTQSVEELKRTYDASLLADKQRLYSDEEAGKYEALAAEKADAVQAFLSRFPFSEDEKYPFETLKRTLQDVSALTGAIAESDARIDALTEKANSEKLLHAGERYAELERKIAEVSEAIRASEAGITVLSTKIDAFDDLEARKESLEAELSDAVAEKEAKTKELDVIRRAQDLLTASADRLTAKYIGTTRTAFAEMMKTVGYEGEYHISTSFEIAREENAISHNAAEYSRGTRDLFDFALRLSLNDALFTGEKPFLLLDDPLLALDDSRFEQAAKILKALSKSYQILYFTCTQKRAID